MHDDSTTIFEETAQIPHEELEIHLQTCRDEISLVQSRLRDLELRRTQLETRLKERQRVSSALRKLPTEIWTEIFSLCVSDHHLSISETGWNRVDAVPYILSHVCCRWRNVITSYPGLWSSIYVNLYALDRDITPLLQSYFSRSSIGRGPEVVLQFRKGSGVNARGDWVERKDQGRYIECLREGPWTVDAGKAFEWILENSGSLRMFSVLNLKVHPSLPLRDNSLSLHSGEPQQDGLRPNLHFPLLESLTFLGEADSLPSWLYDALHTASKLHRLNLDSRGTASQPRNESSTHGVSISELLSYSHIQTLEIGNSGVFKRGYSDLLSILSTLGYLETLQVDVGSAEDQAFVPSSDLLLPARNENLKLLTVTSKSNSNDASATVLQLLEALELPSLESLDLSGCGYQETTTDFSGVLGRFTRLQNLSLSIQHDGGDTHDVENLCSLLRALPHLRSLDLSIKGSRGVGGSYITSFFNSFTEERNFGTGTGRELKKLSITESDAVLTAGVAESVVASLERRNGALVAVSNSPPPGLDLVGATNSLSLSYGLEEVRLVFGGYRYSDVDAISSFGERLRVLEEWVKCAFFYTSWGLKSFVFGSEALVE